MIIAELSVLENDRADYAGKLITTGRRHIMIASYLRMQANRRHKTAASRRRAAAALAKRALCAACDEKGEGFVDVLVKMLIVVVVGAVLLTIMRTAIPQLFTDMITKIRDIFQV